MSKIRFVVLVLLLTLFIFIFPLVVIDILDLQTFFLVSFGLIIIYYLLRKNEKRKLINISKIYLDQCDPIEYLNQYQKFIENTITTKKTKSLFIITKALAYTSAGKIDDCKRLLDQLLEDEPKFDPITRFWYFKAWIYYFEELNEIEQIKPLIHQIKLIIDNSSMKYKPQMISNYNQIIARYYVTSGIYLDLAEEEFSKVFNGKYPKLNIVLSVYYLGVISYKRNNYKLALEYLNSVKKNGNKLEVVNKANNYIQKIKEEMTNS